MNKQSTHAFTLTPDELSDKMLLFYNHDYLANDLPTLVYAIKYLMYPKELKFFQPIVKMSLSITWLIYDGIKSYHAWPWWNYLVNEI